MACFVVHTVRSIWTVLLSRSWHSVNRWHCSTFWSNPSRILIELCDVIHHMKGKILLIPNMYVLLRLDNSRVCSRFFSILASKMTFFAKKNAIIGTWHIILKELVFLSTDNRLWLIFSLLVPPSGQKKKKTNFWPMT